MTVLEGNGGVAGRSGLILGRGDLSRKTSCGYLRSNKDGSFMKILEVQNLPVSHDTVSHSHNLIGDA